MQPLKYPVLTHCGILVAVLVAVHTANAHWHGKTPACPDGKCRS